MIPQETVSKILDTAQIVDVVEDFVSLKRRGANYIACCPFHNEKTPSFYVSPAKGIYKCFGCGKSGTAIGFVMEHENLSYPEALKYLARKYGIEVKEKEETAEEIALRQRSDSLLLVSEFAQKFFVESLKTDEGRTIGYRYFKSRGLEDETIAKWGLGWAPTGRKALTEAALSKGFKEEYLVDTGLSIKYDDGRIQDRFFDRVMFPIHSVSGRVIAFGGRTLKTDKTVAKYVNSPETEIYDKSRSLYGIWFAKNEMSKKDKCYLVEGYLDVLSMHQLGITNVVASSGTSLTVPQIRLIHKFTENVTIMYDGDSAGIHAALRGIGLVLKEGLNVKVVLLPDGDDPDSYSRKHTLEEVESFIASHEQDFISFKTDLLLGEAGNDPLKRADLINDIADTISLIPDAVKRTVYVQASASRFDVDSQILFNRIKKAREKMIEDDRKAAQREKMRAQREERRQNAPVSGEDVPPPEEYIPDGFYQEDEGLPPYDQDYGEPVSDAPSDARELLFEKPALMACEKDILSLILGYGLSDLEFETDSPFYDVNGCTTVADFIRDAFESDNHQLENSVYRRVYDMYFQLYDGNPSMTQEDILKVMMDGPDRTVAGLVADLTTEKYNLSVKNFKDSMTAKSTYLVNAVPKTILAYQTKRLEVRGWELRDSMKGLSFDEMKPILEEINKIASLRKTFEERLGRIR